MMTTDEIIEMAVSNGFYKNDEGTITSPFIEDVDISELLLGFAEDVAAKEREEIISITETQEFSRMYGEFTPSAYDLVKAIRARAQAARGEA